MKGPYGGMELPGQAPGQQWAEVNTLGARLSVELDCTVRWPGFDKNMFVCYHGYSIPIYRLKGTDDWSVIVSEHKDFIRRNNETPR